MATAPVVLWMPLAISGGLEPALKKFLLEEMKKRMAEKSERKSSRLKIQNLMMFEGMCIDACTP